jgi:hypothetical protein
MTGKPLVVETLQVVPRLPPWQVKEMQKEIGEESMTAFTIMWHSSSAVCDVLHIEENARMNLISKKINWLEDGSYPADRPEKHWLVWFHKAEQSRGSERSVHEVQSNPGAGPQHEEAGAGCAPHLRGDLSAHCQGRNTTTIG